jgi:hypothetical protein
VLTSLVTVSAQPELERVELALRVADFEVRAVSKDEAVRIASSTPVDLLVAEANPGDGPAGLEWVEAARASAPGMAVILLFTGKPPDEDWCEALGAWWFETPVNLLLLRRCLRALTEQHALIARNCELAQELDARARPDPQPEPAPVSPKPHEIDDLWFAIFGRIGKAGQPKSDSN